MEIDYLTAGSEMEANKVASTRKTQIMHNDCIDVLQELGDSKAHIVD